ncbi:unnamed protein product [Parnassius apollo]|uniref:(apollo) hypothetical protein n=1 Tax=Parnassius apollo TaxID=110799 RepID=A0A8S3VZZ0_PARAO|nr:unnamed protein product [Parnassius apollo]
MRKYLDTGLCMKTEKSPNKDLESYLVKCGIKLQHQLALSTSKAGFEATGIYPFNPDRIPEEAYAPSIPTYNPMPIVDDKDTDTDVSESLLHEAASNISAINTPLSDNNFNSLSASTEQIGNSATNPCQNITVCNEPKKSFYDMLKTP